MADLDLVLDWAGSRARTGPAARATCSICSAARARAPSRRRRWRPGATRRAAAVADYPPTEKLRLEKELLGFYISDHPLRQLAAQVRLLTPIGLAKLEEKADKARVSVVVMVREIRQVTTRKGDRMAVLQLEDLTGTARRWCSRRLTPGLATT